MTATVLDMTATDAVADAVTAEASGLPTLVRLGWLMSQTYWDVPRARSSAVHGLPTVAELGRDQRFALSADLLDALLRAVPMPAAEPPLATTDVRAAWTPAHGDDEREARTAALRAALDALHLRVITALSLAGTPELTAYAVGRQLADSCRVPADGIGALREHVLNRYRVAEVQAGLAVLATRLPNRSAQAVSRSLEHWRDWAAAPEADRWTVDVVGSPLAKQGRVWQAVLTGSTDPTTLLTAEAWLAAADSGSLTASRAARHLVRRFWGLLLAVAAVVVFLVVLALLTAPGQAKVWSSLVSIAGGFGVTAASLRATAKRGVGAVQQQVTAALELEALGWATTVAIG